MKALIKVASIKYKLNLKPSIYGGLAGGAIGALSGARKREGDSERDRAYRVLKRGLVGAAAGGVTGSVTVYSAGKTTRQAHDDGFRFRAKRPDIRKFEYLEFTPERFMHSTE